MNPVRMKVSSSNFMPSRQCLHWAGDVVVGVKLVLLIAMMGAVSFQKGLGAIHAMSHPIGAVFNTHHGTTNAVCMPAVLELNASVIRDRFDKATGYLGVEGGFEGFKAFVQGFNDSFAIPRTLAELGADASRMDDLITMALDDPSCGGNPVPLDRQNLKQLFERSF